jgi:hypothetical protein
MYSDQPLVCCICSQNFAANAGGVHAHRFREGVCSIECQLRKTWRAVHSVMGVGWSALAEDAHVVQHAATLTDEQHGGDRGAFLDEFDAKVRSL